MRLTIDATIRRFPIIAGLKVEWDSRRKPYERVLGVRLLKRRAGNTAPGPYEEIDVPRQGARKYVLITREWLAQVRLGSQDPRRLNLG
jgi:5'-nucleotidase